MYSFDCQVYLIHDCDGCYLRCLQSYLKNRCDSHCCDLLDTLFDVTGYQTCEQLYDFCIDAGVSEESCQTVYDECVNNQ